MSARISICGIDTSTLPKLSHEEMMTLLKQARQGNAASREKFILANLRLVLSVIQRFYSKKGSADDLFQVGTIGLMKAMDNFDMSLSLKFSTYAVPMIIGEIRRYMRDCSAVRVSRSIRDTAYKIITMRQTLEADSGKEVSLCEVAAALGIPESAAKDAMDAISDPISLFEPVYHDGNETVLIMEQIGDKKNYDEKWLNNTAISEAIKKLDAREREILLMRFYQGKTQVEVSDEIGISQAQVSRLEKNAKKSLKKNIE
ncbi:MAG TPA: sigma-70 family RNA polymerase sigma factor [Firmicutes bacterium]|nr:sigma-70 family RNA polymerase sigma factor [Bacillota bacterium]